MLRSKREIPRFFDDNGFVPIEPGIVPAHRWRPDHRPWPLSRHLPRDTDLLQHLEEIEKIRYQDINDVTDEDVNVYGVVGRKP